MNKNECMTWDNVQIINLTPHDIILVDKEGNELITFPRSGIVARLKEESTPHWVFRCADSDIDVPIIRKEYKEIENLPQEEGGIFYIVSYMVLQVSMRYDLLAPGDVMRDENGVIKGCLNFQCF